GKIELRKEPVDLREVVRRAADASAPMIRSRNHRFSFQVPPEPVWLQADATRLEQVVSNLLNNAAKYTPPGGQIDLSVQLEDPSRGKSQISPGSDLPTRGAIIRVRDTGIGIACDMLPRIFDLFTQAHRPADQSEGGLGIGLALVKN